MSLVDLSIIPMDSIQRIEITKGNNSVLYGNNSSAGTINIITDTLPGQKDSLFAKFTAGSFGKYEGALSGTKTAGIYSITGNTNFISSDGFTADQGLTFAYEGEANIAKKMIERSKKSRVQGRKN